MDSPIANTLFSDFNFDASSKKAIYLQLVEEILLLISKGIMAPGSKLPSSRKLAGLLKLNRLTVGKAYQELEMQGWLESYIGKGTFVVSHLPENEPKYLKSTLSENANQVSGFKIVDKKEKGPSLNLLDYALHLDDGYPDPRLAPLRELSRAYRTQLTTGTLYNKLGRYGSPYGSDQFRLALSNYLNHTRGLKATEKNILAVRGTVMGMNLVCNGLIAPGDVVVAGVPGWSRAEMNFKHAGAHFIGIPVDENGLIVDELRAICQKKTVRMVYVTSHHHYPTTVSLSMDRRLELLQLSEKYGFIIFEDDYDFDFHYKHRPLLPLASADEQGMVIYCGSFSKTFSPAFRLGYLMASENVIRHLSDVRLILDRQGDQILENAMAELLHDGTIQRTLRKTVAIYRERRDYFCNLLSTHLADEIAFKIPEGGLTVWAKFDPYIDLKKLAMAAGKKDLYLSDGSIHRSSSFQENATRLGFASSDKSDLEKSVYLLMKVIKGL